MNLAPRASLLALLLVCVTAARAQVHVEVPAPAPESPEHIAPVQAPCFAIERIELSGDEAATFAWAVAAAGHASDGSSDPAIGRCLGVQGVNVVTRRIHNAILARGYVTTRVLLPSQDLSSGTLRLGILPGRVGAIRLAQDEVGRGNAWNAVPISPGQLLNLRDIEQALDNFQRVPTAEADIQILPSEPVSGRTEGLPGKSDLAIQWKQRLPFRLGLSVDDSGTRTTGRHQGTLTFSYDNAFNLNDLFYVSIVESLRGMGEGPASGAAGAHGIRGRTAHYSLPFGRWLLALNAGSNHYHQSVAGAEQSYIYSGESRTQDIRLTRLLHRDSYRKSHLFLRGWSRQSHNFIDDTEIEVQRRRVAGWELGAQHHQILGRAALDLRLSYRRGTGAMQALPAPEDAFGEGASRARITLADVALVVPWGSGVQRGRYTATASAQWTQQALVPQDRFAIGGRQTVRGFDGESALSAARGRWLRQELEWHLAGTGQALYLGLDYGEVAGAATENLAGTRLAGAVIGWRGGYRRASWDAFAGRPLKKPEMFRTADRTAGFSFHLSF